MKIMGNPRNTPENPKLNCFFLGDLFTLFLWPSFGASAFPSAFRQSKRFGVFSKTRGLKDLEVNPFKARKPEKHSAKSFNTPRAPLLPS